jgi:phosphoribosylformimino-5-aminoimidazole carboxamide ribotide isomerase
MNPEDFLVYPAIDLQGGQVVRLRQGQKTDKKTFNVSPEKAAEKWLVEGAKWLHVVNLDGAFGEDSNANINALRKILTKANGAAKVQFGGGVRDLASIDFMLSLGISRVIMGTAAVREPELLKTALNTFGPNKIVLGVDAKDGKVRISGWEENSDISPIDLIDKFLPDGLRTLVFTNIRRDGTQTGVDIQTTRKIAKATGLNVIASGGVANLMDIQLVKEAELAGVIVGKALYENNFKLSEAMRC